MTNYPDFGVNVLELPPKQALRQFWWALTMMTWSPRSWTLRHDSCVDLPSAWWLAGHAIEYHDDVMAELRAESIL